MMKKRYRNGDIWDFEHEMAVAASREVVLGLDGGTTSTVCICMPLIPYTDLLPDPIPVLARSIAGCSNHNSVGETAVRETLEQVMADALSRSGSNRFAVRAVCLAVSGVNHPTDQQRILSWLRLRRRIQGLFVSLSKLLSLANWGLLVLLAQQLSAKMAAAFPSKSLRAARSLLGGVGNNLGVQGTPHEMSCSEFLFQQCRTFIQMRTNLKVVDNSGDSVAETAPEISASCLEPAPEPEQNDAVAALASGTMGKLHGCVLIAGTGTIAYGFTEDGREARAAGAGPILGDWGSGYGVAAQALTAVVRAHDGRGPLTMLTRGILQSLELSSPDELIGWTYADPSWARIAALVPVVVSCAEAGDQVANKILLDAVQELASSVKAVVQRLGLSGEDGKNSFPLVMVGGVLEANKRWDIGSGKEVINSIVNDFPGALPIRPRLKGSILKLLLLQQEKLSSPVCEAVKGTTGTMIKAYFCVLDWQFCFRQC
ncbi:hypothetical protein TEA_025669 [Camellia sinensis var. sinensis]|uniref:N-acetyl-D-glucosamine kinase n=1 Tax=Camellia sinensis var. sinensis TaxID=542762 RepID=A0A4S4E616_CAMSN|nr:hypothetical protein TEA_025669 [Camellia sinensis var. sinensis]